MARPKVSRTFSITLFQQCARFTLQSLFLRLPGEVKSGHIDRYCRLAGPSIVRI
jgi:hypothetical protein